MPRLKRSEAEQAIADEHGRDFVEVLARGLKVITAFETASRPMTLSEVALAVDLPRATVRRLLHTLRVMGHIEGESSFVPTARTLDLARAYLSTSIPKRLQPIVERVSREAGEACSAAVLDGDEVVFVARSAPSRIVSVGLQVGYRLPAYCTSVGRVLLADLGPEELAAHLARADIRALTDRTITDLSALRSVVMQARSQGYAFVDEEAERGLRSVAVPVRRADGRAACALHIAVQTGRASVAMMTGDHLARLQAAAREAEAVLI